MENKFLENEDIYIKLKSKYLGDDLSRPYFNTSNYTYLYNRLDTALNLAGKNTTNTSFRKMSDWVEDNNHINENLQFTNIEILIVLAIFDGFMGEGLYNITKKLKSKGSTYIIFR